MPLLAGKVELQTPWVFFEINSRVINGHPIANEGCLLHPPERTCSESEPMSAKCQKRTSSRISQAETKLGPRSKSRGNRGRDHLDDLFG